MKKIFSLLNSILILCTISYGQIILPVEVLGDEGKVVTRNVSLTNEIASSTERLWLQVNNLGYENKASVRINSGTWYALNHESVEMQNQEKARGGMVHGGFNTIRFSIPANDFQEGENIIRFRFNTSDGISMGYRVIRLNLLDAQDKKLLDESYFEEDDPKTWEAPLSDAQSIAEGEDLWRNADLWTSKYPGKWYAYDLGGFTPIQAKCADCHAQDGRDLEIFAYSNDAIIERAKFHNLSEMDGKKIASYIRSLSEKDETIKRIGRPWNPPYQPGTELKGKPIENWAAGAGLDAVLEEDEDMLPYMFPNGVNEETVDAFFDQDTPDIDRTVLPIAIQFPDWKHWLPMIHPKDAFTKGNTYADTYADREPYINNNKSKLNPEKGYEMFREYLETLPKKGTGNQIDIAALTNNQKTTLIRQHEIFHYNFRHYFIQQGNGGSHWRTGHGPYINSVNNNTPITFALTSMARLQAVKNFEIMQEFGLQDQMDDLFNTEDFPTKRQWLHGDSKHVFEIPAHITGCQDDDGNCQNFEGQPEVTGQYESTVWYHLQNILAGGEGTQWWNGPVDYNYQPQFILKASYSSGINEPLRYYHSMATMYKIKSWSGGQDISDGYGYRIRQQGPWRFFGKQGRLTRSGFYKHEVGKWPTLLNDIKPGLSKLFLNALLKEFLKSVNKIPIDEWPREGDEGVREGQFLEKKNKSSVIDVTQNVSTGGNVIWADNMYWIIPEAMKHGVDCEVIEEVIDWCESAWSTIDFEKFRNQSIPYVSLVQQMNCDNNIVAHSSNSGNNPAFIWRVNGIKVSETSNTLSKEFFTVGDEVTIRVNGSAQCATGNVVNGIVTVISNPINCEAIIPIDSAYYSFEEADFSQGVSDQWNDNHLTNIGATPMENTQRTYAYFDGIDDVMNGQTNTLEFNSSTITVEAWVNLNTDLGTTQRIVTLNPSGALLFRLNPSGQFQTVITSDIGGTNTKQNLNSTTKIPTNTWTHLVSVITDDSLKMYINGELNISQVLTTPIDFDGTGTGLQVVLGSTTTTPEGMIDEVKIYNRTLSVDEIKSSFNEFNTITALENNSFLGMNIYPNPVTDKLTINFNLESNEIFNITLTTIDGRNLYTNLCQGVEGENVIQLDIEQLNYGQGILFLHIQGKQMILTEKIMLNPVGK